MAFSENQLKYIEQLLQGYLDRERPPKEIQDKLDVGYRIEDQNVFIYEIRPRWDNPDQIMHLDFAKARYVKSNDLWKIYWKRGSGNWSPYQPAQVGNFKKVIDLVEKDSYGAFRG